MSQSVIGALRVNLGLDSAQFERGVKKAQTTTETLGRNLQKIGTAVSVVGAGIGLAIRGQLNAADRLAKTSQQIGVPVETLSQLEHAAKLSGISFGNMETALRRLSQVIVDDNDKLGQLGIAVRDVNGEVRPTVDVMADLADVLAQMPDGAEKTALAMELMGRSGTEMIPMLNKGGDALRAMMEEADRLGLTISQETAEAAERFNDNLTRLGGQMQGIVRIVTAELAPVLEKISDVVVEVAGKFGELSPEMRRIIGIVAGITVVLGPVLIALGSLVLVIGALSAPVLAVIGVFAGLAALFALFPDEAKAVINVVIDLAKMAFEPLKLAVGFVIETFKELKPTIEAVIEFMVNLFDGVISLKDGLIDLGVAGVDFVKEKFLDLIGFLRNIPGQLKNLGSDLMDGLKDGITGAAGAATGAIKGAANSVVNGAKSVFRVQSPSLVFKEMGEDLIKGLGIGIKGSESVGVSAMQNAGNRLNQTATSSFSQVSSTIQSQMGNAFMSIIDGSVSAGQAFRNMANSILQDVSRMVINRAISGAIGSFIPGFANGTPFAPGGLALVGERGPELVNLPRGSKVIDAQRTQGMMGGGGGQTVVNQTINVSTGVQQTVRTEIASLLPQIAEASKRAVLDARKRGGSFATAFGG